MYIATIDCGTTNSRVYIVNAQAEIVGQAEKKVGVRDTAILGSNEKLKKELSETFYQALERAGQKIKDIDFVISSGMITSEIGLIEIPHIWAPAGINELASNIKKVHDLSVFPVDIPVYFIRGIKNKYDPKTATINDVGKLDFMRGEETQVIGLLNSYDVKPPLTVVMLSSHTKSIPIDEQGNILGSITTVSGQVYEAILKETFVGKSVRKDSDFDDEHYFAENIIDAANNWVTESGFLRSLLLPRFMDVLLETQWYERKLFVESIIASEDLNCLSQLREFNLTPSEKVVLIGAPRRSSIYEYLLKEKMNVKNIKKITEKRDIDYLSISGAFQIAKLAGLIS